MTDLASGRLPAGQWLDAEAAQRLGHRLDSTLRRARATGTSALASVTAWVDGSLDPTSAVVASRSGCSRQNHGSPGRREATI